ncbi:MAG TPA: lytic transglycosylase domain-containing protein [Pusillimonas sp.]|uniref:lytic transglycosylase domain-containing protein n=1 Tax=Pusillimonas sp. TaxID=3040095 RepID=UPI002BF9BD31|nr:lytic transglycosylase domain-containing protein [Pusillimonas sp.]HUH86947.1 lytic transglycosylase domain-containing protein [Pusillimonas sp.]
MSASDTFAWVERSVRAIGRRLAEVTHAAAVYLGIAVLVIVALSFIVPSLRDQSQQIHAALLVSLKPEGMDGAAGLTLAQRLSGGRVVLRSGTGSDPEAKDGFSEPQTFAEALGAIDSFSIPGVSKVQAQALRSYIARKYRIAHDVAGVLIHTVYAVAHEKQLDPLLILAVIAIESRYNPFAESHVGAQGLMQVMTRVHEEKFEPFEGGPDAALNPIANIRVGSQILHDCIRRRGSVAGGLACYVGATGPTDGGYGAKVLAERRRLSLASGIAPRQ